GRRIRRVEVRRDPDRDGAEERGQAGTPAEGRRSSLGGLPTANGSSVDQAGLHLVDGDPPGKKGEAGEEGEAGEVDPLEAEGAAADQFDQLVQRVGLGDDLEA